jgi:hypothetical protein
MRARYLVPLVLLLSACGTQRVLCPADTTSDVDATITQVTNPAVFSQRSFATVEYAITVTNRTSEPMRVRSLTLTSPDWSAGTRETLRQCFGLERLNADVMTVSQGFNRTVAPGGSETFTLRTRKGFDQWDPLLNNPTLLAVDVRTESTARTRSDHLTRKVTLKVPQSGNQS